MKVLGIDPGTTHSAFVVWDGEAEQITNKGKLLNEILLYNLKVWENVSPCVIEQIASYGMPVGEEVFETVFWSGRFFQVRGCNVYRMKRGVVKNHICHSSKANDATIRQALMDRFGKPGTKKEQGKLYGVTGDMWAALALAVTFYDRRAVEILEEVRKHG